MGLVQPRAEGSLYHCAVFRRSLMDGRWQPSPAGACLLHLRRNTKGIWKLVLYRQRIKLQLDLHFGKMS